MEGNWQDFVQTDSEGNLHTTCCQCGTFVYVEQGTLVRTADKSVPMDIACPAGFATGHLKAAL